MAEMLSLSETKSGARDEVIASLAAKIVGKNGNPDADFEKIVRMCEKAVYETALGVTKNREDALDVSQEAFVKLWQLVTDEKQVSEVRSWYSYILRMTRNCALDFLRRQGIRRSDSLTVTDENGEIKDMDIPDDDINSDPVKAYERKERVEAVRAAINSLDDDYKQILILRESEGLSYKEISDIMSIEMGTVKSKIFRARAGVKEYLEKRNIL